MPSGAVALAVGRPSRRWPEILWAGASLVALGGVLWTAGARENARHDPGAAIVPVNAASAADAAPQPGANVEQPQPTGPAGWALVVSTPGTTPPRQARRLASSAAFTLREGQTLDATVPGEGMAAAFAGTVTITEPGRYRFGMQVQGGTARLSAFDQTGRRVGEIQNAGDPGGVWTAWADLRPGPVTVSIQFARAAGAARLRTLWERQGTVDQGGFPPEPIPASAVAAPRYAQRDVAAAAGAFHGRVLMGELNCTGCHRAGPGSEAVLTARTAPMLGEIGRRAQPEWMRRWVADPQAMKPGCGMPDVIGDADRDKADAEAITHFLVSLGGPADPEPAATEPQVLDLGRRLYHTIGCVSCHGALESPAKVFTGESQPTAVPDAPPEQPFGKVAGKWRPGPLSEFLKDPLRTHPAGRMPSMLLKDSEADAIATYLVSAWGPGDAPGAAFEVDPAKVDSGKAAFAARGCASCHQLGGNRPGIPPTLKAKPLAELAAGAGCLSPTDTVAPRFGLSGQDRADLAAAIEMVKSVAAMPRPGAAPLDEGERLVAAFNCLACHTKDERGGPADALKPYFRTLDDTELGDEGRLPPRLSGVGNKLNPPWIRAVLTDAGAARPYMATRMPQFGKLNVGRLHTMLVAMDGAAVEPDNPSEPKATDELVLAGRKLSGEKGMNCVSCHTWAGKTAGTPGPDITGFAERLRYDWWKSYVLAPARYKPGTRMTAFYATGHGQVQDVFGGDPHRQTDALWAYFTTGKFGPAPEGLPGGQGLPVAIGDRPVVFRTFLKDAGSRGIAVGYPIGIHFGFDATAVRLVDAWQGDFVDASSAWKGRGGEVAGGQGTTVWTAPAGPPLVIGAKPEAWPTQTGRESGYLFKGYRIEKDGTPVFMYAIGGGAEAAPVEVSERFSPKPRSGALIARTFEIHGLPAGQAVWVNSGRAQECRMTALAGARVEEVSADEGAKWFGVTPASGGAASFTVEITP